jgi:hypothetical protein
MPATQPLQIVIAIIAVLILAMAYFAAASLSYQSCAESRIASSPRNFASQGASGCSKWDPFPQS